MPTTPGFLRGEAVSQIIGALHTAHKAGPWQVETVTTAPVYPSGDGQRVINRTTLTIAVGTVYPDDQADARERLTIIVTDPE